MHFIDVPDHVADKLAELPISTRSRRLERAINRALDAEGWPHLAPHELAHEAAGDYWYVTIWDRIGMLLGHVGPIHTRYRAEAAADSWRAGKAHRATVGRLAFGPAMTNTHHA